MKCEIIYMDTYPVSNSYGDIPLDETAPDLLASDSPSQSPGQNQQQHQQQQQQHQQHFLSHLTPSQQQQLQNHQLVNSSSIAYVTQPPAPYPTIPKAEPGSHLQYANEAVPELISQSLADMRTGPGGGGRVDGGGGSGKRGWKRKRDESSMDERQQNRLDASHRCDVCGEQASGHYFGALVCLPCKFFIRCTKDGRPNFSNQCGGKCDVLKGGRVRCQHCRFQKCISAGMYRKEKPEAVEPAEGQLLCKVCGDIANGVHFGVTTCEGCKKFFRRGLKENRTYTCKGNMRCSINPRMRNNCRYCRYQKCLYEGMSREAIKMGRPKKGELSYRKPVKKNGIKPLMKSYDKHMMGSNRSSLSSEYDQDDVSTPEDVFNSMSAGQHHQIAPAHQQLGSHLHQQQPQHLQQQQQQQQSGSFSLGSILHDCMTVQDWDQKMDMSEMDHDGQRGQAQSLVITPASASSGNMMDDGRQVSPHNMRHTSPTIHSDLIAQQMQQRQQQQQLRHNQQLQLPHQPQGQQDVKQLERQYVVSYQDPRQSSGNMDVMSSIEYPNEHDLPVNRPIKVENVSLQDGPGSAFGESVVLEDMQNLQSINKTEFTNYQLQGLDPNSPYNVGEQRTATSTPTSGSTLVPISQLEPSVSSQIVAINMSSQNVYYTPHSHNEPIIIRNMNLPQQTLAPTQNHQGLEQNHVDPDLKSSSNDSAMNRGQDISNELFSSGNYHIIKSDGTIRVAHQPHAMSTNSQGHTSVLQQQFISDSDSGQNSGRSRKLRDVNESDFTILTPSGQQAVTSVPSSIAVSSSSNIHPKISGIKSPIAAILQQHRDAIQAGRPVQLSSEEIEELLNSVNAEQARTQRILDNEQLILKGQNVVDDPNIVDLRRQPMDNFMALNDPHQNESGIPYRNTPPNAGRTFPHSSPSSQYQSNSPGNQSMTQIQRRPYTNQISPTSEPGGGEKQDYGRAYGIITSVANNNNNNNNNNNSQISHYISSPSPPHVGHHGNRSPPDEIFDDSFNSALIRDSTLLHEINRIFLGIDNSCETYGCHRRNDNDVDKEINNKSVMMGCLSPDEFSPEVSHKYWHSFKPSERFVEMTAERQKIIQAVLDAFDNLQRTYATNEPEYVNKKMSHDQLEHWHLIQRRIARHVVAGQRFCRNIPGYFKLDIQDRISLGKHVGFGLMVLIACTEFYDPEFKRFRYIWNWTMPMQNPLFSYKVHLLSLGNRIHEIEMDRTEASMLCAISMTSIDCPGLVKPEIVCEVRDGLIDALQAHISAKTESTQRLKKLLSFMPQVRLMTVWYNNLMKKMSLPSDIINSKISKPLARGSTEVENAASFS